MKKLVYKTTFKVLWDVVLPVAAWMSGYRGRRKVD